MTSIAEVKSPDSVTRAALYVRVSTKEQTPENQERALCVNVGETSAPGEFSVEGGGAMRDEHG